VGAFVDITNLYLLVVTTLGAGERSYFSRAVGRHDGSLVPVEDVAARLAFLPEGHDRAPFVYYLSAHNLYRHLAELLTRADPLIALPTKEFAPERACWVCGRRRSVAWLAEAGKSVLPPYGVAAPDHPLVRLPAVADLFFHLLLDTGERGFTHVTDSRGLVLDAEEHGVLALDSLLLYWL
jgi:hypothetical protein